MPVQNIDMSSVMARSDIVATDEGALIDFGRQEPTFIVIVDGIGVVYYDPSDELADGVVESHAVLASKSLKLNSGEAYEFKNPDRRPDKISLKCATGETCPVRVSRA